MRRYTEESYILIYTKEGVFTARDVSDHEFQSFSENVLDGVICKRGIAHQRL
jgi:hypothetical protein